MENDSLLPLVPPPEERLHAWLSEIYGKQVRLRSRQLLRHRDLSFVERLQVADAIPETLIYKVVLPPWDIEQDLHERVLIPSISNSARLYLCGNYLNQTALFLEDLGRSSLLTSDDPEDPMKIGTELAKLHRAYTYRVGEVKDLGILPCFEPADYPELAKVLGEHLESWHLSAKVQSSNLSKLADGIAQAFSNETVSLVHGDLYSENIIVDNGRHYFIDWSWFAHIGVPLLDLATLTMEHAKNGQFSKHRLEIIDAYCFEYGRSLEAVMPLLIQAEHLSRLFFLNWLVERRKRGILGTTVGPVDDLIKTLLRELESRLNGDF